MAILDRLKHFLSDVPEPRPKQASGNPPTSSVGGSGTPIIGGFAQDLGEYNANLAGWNAMSVYDKMRRQDADCQALETACTLPIRAANWQVVPGAEESDPQFEFAKEIAEEVEKNLISGLESPTESGTWNTQSWESVVQNALLVVPFGCAGHEILYHIDGDKVRIRRMAPRLPVTFYRFIPDDDGETLKAMQQYGYRGGQFIQPEIGADALTLFAINQEGAYYYGRAIFRPAYKHWWMKDQLYRIAAIGAEKNTIGIPVIEQGENAGVDDRKAAAEWAKNLAANEQSSLSLPFGWKAQLMGITGSLYDPMPLIQHHSQMIMRAGLAEFMKLGDTQSGSRAVGNVFVDFFYLSLEAIARMIAQRITHSDIRHLVDFNYRGGLEGQPIPYPRLEAQGVASVNLLDLLASLKDVASANVDLIEHTKEVQQYLGKRLGLPIGGEIVPRDKPAAVTSTGLPSGPTSPQNPNQPQNQGQESTKPMSDLRQPVPGEQHYDWQAHDARVKTTAGVISRLLNRERPTRLRQWIRAVVRTGRPEQFASATVPFDRQLLNRIETALGPARKFGQQEPWRMRQRATGRRKISAVHMAGIPPNPDPKQVNARPVVSDGQLVAEAAMVEYDNWLRSTAVAGVLNAEREGRIPRNFSSGKTLDEIVNEIAASGLTVSAATIDRIAARAAIQAVVRENLSEIAKMGKEVKRIYRTEVLDQNTCAPCVAGNGQNWPTADAVDWFPGDDCEGGLNCRGGFVADFVGPQG